MAESLDQLILRVQAQPSQFPLGSTSVADLTEAVLRLRLICRSARPRQPLTEPYQTVLMQLRQQLSQSILAAWEHPQSLGRPSPTHWASAMLQHAYEQVLDEPRLKSLAVAAQQSPAKTHDRQYALGELLKALQCSGKVWLQPNRSRLSEAQEEGFANTLLYVCQHLDRYDPDRGEFLAWVRFRLNMTLRETHQVVTQDPFTQASVGRVIRVKYQLRSLLKQFHLRDLWNWIGWQLRGILVQPVLQQLQRLVAVLVQLADLFRQDPDRADQLLLALAQATVPTLAQRNQPTEESMPLENLPAAPVELSLGEELRQYFEKDPQGLLQRHIKDHPEATVQAIAMARLNNVSWQDLSKTFGIAIPTLSNFFQRRLKELAPQIRAYIQADFP